MSCTSEATFILLMRFYTIKRLGSVTFFELYIEGEAGW